MQKWREKLSLHTNYEILYKICKYYTRKSNRYETTSILPFYNGSFSNGNSIKISTKIELYIRKTYENIKQIIVYHLQNGFRFIVN